MSSEQKKFRLLDESIGGRGWRLYRIQALKSFKRPVGDPQDMREFAVKVGDKGGFIEKEENLSHDGNSWVADEARVFGSARVYTLPRDGANTSLCARSLSIPHLVSRD